MPNPGIATAYDLTIGVKVNMDEAIYMISPMDSPLLTGLGADGMSVLSTRPVDQILFEWMDEEILTPRSALNGAVTTGDTVLTVTSNDRTKFSTGDVVRAVKGGVASPEIMRVTGYGTTDHTLLVARALSGTATNYASGAELVGVGTALAEGSDPESARTQDRNRRTNYTQIFGPTAIQMSRTETGLSKYGVANEWSKQLYNRMSENVISREQAFLYGASYNSATTRIRTTGGMVAQITSNVDVTSTQLTIAKIVTNMTACYQAGGVPELLMANPQSLTDLNDVVNTNRVNAGDGITLNQAIDDPRRGRVSVMTVFTEYGPLAVVRNRWLAKTDAIAWSRDGVIRRVFDPVVYEALAKTGDSVKGQIVGEEGLQVKGQSHMFRMSNLTAY